MSASESSRREVQQKREEIRDVDAEHEVCRTHQTQELMLAPG